MPVVETTGGPQVPTDARKLKCVPGRQSVSGRFTAAVCATAAPPQLQRHQQQRRRMHDQVEGVSSGRTSAPCRRRRNFSTRWGSGVIGATAIQPPTAATISNGSGRASSAWLCTRQSAAARPADCLSAKSQNRNSRMFCGVRRNLERPTGDFAQRSHTLGAHSIRPSGFMIRWAAPAVGHMMFFGSVPRR